jgi:hypothetical protein
MRGSNAERHIEGRGNLGQNFMTRRFERLLDPCGRWTVWDNDNQLPAERDGKVLNPATPQEAEALIALLNRIERRMHSANDR